MLLTIAFVGVGLALPAVLLAAGVLHRRGTRAEPPESTDWQLLVFSTLLCTIAFNLTFFLQELFLVLPKALVPGLDPTLYHDDHEWTGRAPIAELFEGTAAVAILISGLISKFAFERVRSRSPWRPFALWMAFEGLFQALPQFVLGATWASTIARISSFIPGNDIGRAYAYLHFSSITRSIIALVALFAIHVRAFG